MANLGIQNNNIGNLKDPASNTFRQFSNPEEGFQALVNDIKIKQSGQSAHIQPGASLEQFANVWAPASDHNDPHNYAMTLAKVLGVPTAQAFDTIPPEHLAKAISVAEGTNSILPSGNIGMGSDNTTNTTNTTPPKNSEAIKENVLKLQQAGANPQDIEEYVKRAASEGSQSSSTATIPTRKTFADSIGAIQTEQAQKEATNSEPPKKRGVLGSLVHGIVEPVATTLARPVQAIAEGLGGASAEDVDKVTKSIAGDWVAPTPKNAKDVLGDVVRAGETVLTGAGVSKLGEGVGALRAAMAAKNTALGDSLIKSALMEQLGPGETLANLTKPEIKQILESIVKETPMSNSKLIQAAEQALQELAPQGAKVAKASSIASGLKFGLGLEGLNIAKSGFNYIKNKAIDNAYQKK